MTDTDETTAYAVTAEASDNTYLFCNSTDTSCYLYGALCDLRYTIIATDSADQCNSARSPPYTVNMGTAWVFPTLFGFSKNAH